MVRKTIQVGLLGVASLFSTYAVADWSISDYFNSITPSFNVGSESSQVKILSAKAPSLNPEAIKLGLQAYNKVRQEGMDQQQLLTIVDYSKPSTERRLYVFDLKQNNVLFREYVAHGKNSGGNVPTSFSNSPSSLKSSIGVFVTQQTYIGKHGYSLRVNGLERGINDMAASRAIVMHAASYVGADVASKYGRLGKTWGCFGVSPRAAGPIINTIKGGTVLFAYYPDRNYMRHSRFMS